MRAFARQAAIVGAAACAGHATAQAPANTTGVSGAVLISPTVPGPQRTGVSTSGPYASAPVQLRDAQGRLAGRAIADAQGRFMIAAAPGQYELVVVPGEAPWPRCETTDVTVRAGLIISADVHCDSGMR